MNDQKIEANEDGQSSALGAVAHGSAFRRGQRVNVKFNDGADDENWTGLGWFVRHVLAGQGWDAYLSNEPHCLVKTSKDDWGSCFPTRCVKPNDGAQRACGPEDVR